MTITRTHRIITAVGEISIFELYSSKYRVSPPCPDGNRILSSAMGISFLSIL